MNVAAADFSLELELMKKGVVPVAGVDEVGRGPLAGPVCAAAVILDPEAIPEGLADSKTLSAKAREAAYAGILARARAIGIAFVTAREIDATDIRRAALQAMSQAVAALPIAPAHALIDGRDLPILNCSGAAIVKGDAKSASIAAASIVAKVTRDKMMCCIARDFPEYGFDTNVGYGARRHLEALAKLGPTPHHRLSFAPLRPRETPSARARRGP